MSEAILLEIVAVEKEADRLEEDARIQARGILAEAKKKAAETVEKSITDSEALTSSIFVKAQEEAQTEILKHKEVAASSAVQLKNAAGQKMDQAVQFILGRIVDLSGNH